MLTKLNRLFTFVYILALILPLKSFGQSFNYSNKCGINGCEQIISAPENTNATVEIHQMEKRSTTVFKFGNSVTGKPQKITPTPPLQIPIRFSPTMADQNNPGKIYAGLTEIIPKSRIFAGALHVFRQDQSQVELNAETVNILEKFKIIIFRSSVLKNYLDLVFFVPKELTVEDLKMILNSITIPEINTPWISYQIGLINSQIDTEQLSTGLIVMKRNQGVGSLYFNLSDSQSNYTSAASSGSLILSENYKPMAILQCLESIPGEENLRNSSSQLYRALSLNIDFNLVTPLYPDDLQELQAIAQKLIIEPNCIPVDRNGAGE